MLVKLTEMALPMESFAKTADYDVQKYVSVQTRKEFLVAGVNQSVV